MARVDPADLAVFLSIATHRSFRKAATELDVTPSALSHSLRAFEERLDLRLFNRTTRSVALTEAGERLFTRIQPAFRDIADALEDLDGFRGKPSGRLRLNASRPAASLVLMPIIRRFVRAFPEVRVELVVENALVDVVSAGFDAGVRLGESLAADMIATAIGPRQRFVVVGSPAFFERHRRPVKPADLHGIPCVRFRFMGGGYYRWEFERGGVELDIDVDGPLALTEQDHMVEAALDGLGLAFVMEGSVAAEVAAGRLETVLDDWCPYFPGFFLYYPSRRHMPAALKAFVEFAKAHRQDVAS